MQAQPADAEKTDQYMRQHQERATQAQGRYEDVMRQRQDAVRQAQSILDKTIEEMRAAHTGSGPGQINLPLLALGAGLLDPTSKGGFGASFGEQLSRGLGNMGSVISQQRAKDADFLKGVAELQQRRAALGDVPLKDAAALARAEQLQEEQSVAGLEKARITSKMDRPQSLGPGILYDPKSGKVVDAYTQQEVNLNPSVPGANGQPQSLIGSSVHGDDFLKALNNPVLAQSIKGWGNYDLAVPTMPRSPQALSYMQNMMAMVKQYNPDFDQHNYANIQKGMAAWTGQGQMAMQQRAAMALSEHLGNMQSAAANLNNSDFAAINKAGNMVKAQTGSPAIKSFLAAKQAALTEMAAFLGRGHPAEGQMAAWGQTVDQADSPAALQAAIEQFSSVMHGQAVALARRKTDDLGKSKPYTPEDIYGPETTERLRSILDYDISTPGGSAAAKRRYQNDKHQGAFPTPTPQQWEEGIKVLGRNPSPALRAQFDAEFGPGSAKLVLGN
jgi:hypothetical protein